MSKNDITKIGKIVTRSLEMDFGLTLGIPVLSIDITGNKCDLVAITELLFIHNPVRIGFF